MPGAMSTAKFAHDGQLFARMKLEDNLSQDSMGGRLILLNAQTAWIAADTQDPEEKETVPEKVSVSLQPRVIYVRRTGYQYETRLKKNGI